MTVWWEFDEKPKQLALVRHGLWRGGDACGVVETLHVDAGHSACRVIDKNVGKLCVPDNFVGAVRRPGIDDLGKGLVHPREQNQKLCATGTQFIRRNSV